MRLWERVQGPERVVDAVWVCVGAWVVLGVRVGEADGVRVSFIERDAERVAVRVRVMERVVSVPDAVREGDAVPDTVRDVVAWGEPDPVQDGERGERLGDKLRVLHVGESRDGVLEGVAVVVKERVQDVTERDTDGLSLRVAVRLDKEQVGVALPDRVRDLEGLGAAVADAVGVAVQDAVGDGVVVGSDRERVTVALGVRVRRAEPLGVRDRLWLAGVADAEHEPVVGDAEAEGLRVRDGEGEWLSVALVLGVSEREEVGVREAVRLRVLRLGLAVGVQMEVRVREGLRLQVWLQELVGDVVGVRTGVGEWLGVAKQEAVRLPDALPEEDCETVAVEAEGLWVAVTEAEGVAVQLRVPEPLREGEGTADREGVVDGLQVAERVWVRVALEREDERVDDREWVREEVGT